MTKITIQHDKKYKDERLYDEYFNARNEDGVWQIFTKSEMLAIAKYVEDNPEKFK